MIKEIKIGTCANCAKTIMDYKDGHFKRNPDYTEIWFYLSNNSKMKVAVCRDCKKKMTNKIIKEIMFSHNHTWENEFKKNERIPIEKKNEFIRFWNNIKCLKWALTEKELDKLINNI